MKSDFESKLLSGGKTLRRTCRSVCENAGKTIAIITGIVVTLVTFTDIGFHNFGVRELSTNIAIMLIATYVIFFSLEDAGERLGRSAENYKSAEERYRRLAGGVNGGDIPTLRKFCSDYREAELKYRRENLLMAQGFSLDEYEAHTGNEGLTNETKRLFRKVRKMKPVTLTPAILLSARTTDSSELKSPARGKYAKMFLGLLPSAACMIFTVSIMLSTKELTAAAVTESILKLACLPIIGIRGYTKGYNYATEQSLAWLETKCRLLEAFGESKG